MSADTASERAAEVATFLAAFPATRFVEAFTPDLTGFGFGKRVPIADIDGLYRSGMGFSAAPYVLDPRHLGYAAGGIGWQDGDPDAKGRPRPGTLKPMPWATHPTAQLMLDITMAATNQPLWTDPRLILKQVVDRLAADGFFPCVAFEYEFYLIDSEREANGRIRPPRLARTARPLGYPSNLSVLALEEVADWSLALDDAANAQAIPMGAVVAEMGVGQFEINLHHRNDALAAADDAILLKRMIRGVSRAMGWDATFMAKPYAADVGSGLHVHVSLLDAAGDNAFAAPDRGDAFLRSAIAGLQRLLPDSLGFFAPNRNSFRRFGSLFAPVNRRWGEDNRTVAFRIPTDKGAGRRIEHRVAGADANPYLVLASILAGMHLGLSQNLEPDAPVIGKHAGFKKDLSLPGDIFEAATRLSASRPLRDYMPKRYLETYAHLIREHHRAFLDELAPREYDFFL